MGLMERSIVGCFPEFIFQFSVVQVLVGLPKQFIKNFVFPTWACSANNNNNNNNNCWRVDDFSLSIIHVHFFN